MMAGFSAQADAAMHPGGARERLAKYGRVRPIIHGDSHGNKLVAVGNELHWSPAWRTFPDFLNDYLKRRLGSAWGQKELDKPADQQHPLVRLFVRMSTTWNAQERDVDGLFKAVPSGPMLSWLGVAYDVYILRHHDALQDRLVARLKNSQQFQGARHELFVAAMFIRAGFTLAYENERAGERRHPEFIATHSGSGLLVAVEAKSRHRRGVLGTPGQPSIEATTRADVKGLLEDAFGKRPDYPYVICLDVNLPQHAGAVLEQPWLHEVASELSAFEAAFPDEPDPYTALLCTNHPFHYGDDDQPALATAAATIMAKRPLHPFPDLTIPLALQSAAENFPRIPNTFDE